MPRRDFEKITLFELGPTRDHQVPLRFLDGYKGYLHTDGFEAYETLAAKVPSITLVGDWVHVRRKFDEAIKALPKDFKGEIKVKVGFDMINELFSIESKEIGENASPTDRHRIPRPLIKQLKAWAEQMRPTIRPKSLCGVALRHMLERWG